MEIVAQGLQLCSSGSCHPGRLILLHSCGYTTRVSMYIDISYTVKSKELFEFNVSVLEEASRSGLSSFVVGCIELIPYVGFLFVCRFGYMCVCARACGFFIFRSYRYY